MVVDYALISNVSLKPNVNNNYYYLAELDVVKFFSEMFVVLEDLVTSFRLMKLF